MRNEGRQVRVKQKPPDGSFVFGAGEGIISLTLHSPRSSAQGLTAILPSRFRL